jgi:hypothetical protein
LRGVFAGGSLSRISSVVTALFSFLFCRCSASCLLVPKPKRLGAITTLKTQNASRHAITAIESAIDSCPWTPPFSEL